MSAHGRKRTLFIATLTGLERPLYPRKRTLEIGVLGVSERPLSGKVDIELPLTKGAANDPKQPIIGN